MFLYEKECAIRKNKCNFAPEKKNGRPFSLTVIKNIQLVSHRLNHYNDIFSQP